MPSKGSRSSSYRASRPRKRRFHGNRYTKLEKMADESKKRLTVAQRATIIARLEGGESASHLAIEYGVSQPAISKIKKNKENILANMRNLDEQQGSTAKKKCTGVEESALEIGLYKWYVQKRSLGQTVSGPMLKEKALLFNTMIGGSSDFKASNGWLNRFKNRHSIREFTVQSGKSVCDESSSVEFSKEFAQLVTSNGIDPDYIYNADETSLRWKMIPNETVAAELRLDTEGHETNEDRVTIMVCSNASGSHKIPLLVIGQSKEPNNKTSNNVMVLPVTYKSERNAWINKDLLTEWYTKIFLPALEQKHGSDAKCILLIDNAPSHPPAEVLNAISTICTVNYLPPTVTSLIQPIQDVTKSLKNIYKKKLLSNIVLQHDLQGIVQFLKSWNIVDCCKAIAHAWQSVAEINIKNAWKDILQVTEIPWHDGPYREPYVFLQLLKQLPNGNETTIEEFMKWLNEDPSDPGWKILSDKEIIFAKEERTDEPQMNSMENDEKECLILPDEALQGIKKFEQWYQKRQECSPEHLLLLQHFQDVAVREILAKKLNFERL